MKIEDFLEGVSRVAIAGHTHPDGDCIGSCMGLYLYLRENYPELQVKVYLESPRPEFGFLEGIKEICESYEGTDVPQLLILCDISSADRIGVASAALQDAEKTLCFDHHRTNQNTFSWKFNDPAASSTSEVVFRFLEQDRISTACAEALYLGMVHDTGVFQYTCTSPETMRAAAVLMEKGIPYSRIIDETFYQKSWAQNHMLGVVLSSCRLHLDGTVISAQVTRKLMEENGVGPRDMDGIVAQMRNTAGVDTAIFMYETEAGVWKASLRSRKKTDVSVIAQSFGGGGHVRAAGCTVKEDPEEILQRILSQIAAQAESEQIHV
ncbi:MAG: bifunctional oligoribonuclease/PAP phosphatase NrnA [Lachnospiraceae bacterium]|nr:bifunctional oligoribonuclease/PAP phosphatase NrnA [Lachnospiraceae bacterium]